MIEGIFSSYLAELWCLSWRGLGDGPKERPGCADKHTTVNSSHPLANKLRHMNEAQLANYIHNRKLESMELIRHEQHAEPMEVEQGSPSPGTVSLSEGSPAFSPAEAPRRQWCDFLKRYMGMRHEPESPRFPQNHRDVTDAMVSSVLATIAMLALAVISSYAANPQDGVSPFIPPFGATCAVVFIASSTPSASPRVVVFSHVVGSIFGISFTNALYTVAQPWGARVAGSLAVGATIFVLRVTGTSHPPSCATAVVSALVPFNSMYNDRGYFFIVGSVLLGCAVVLIVAWVGINLVPWRDRYPKYW